MLTNNACTLVERLARRGISVTGVTKATLGSTEIAHTMLLAAACRCHAGNAVTIVLLNSRDGVPRLY